MQKVFKRKYTKFNVREGREGTRNRMSSEERLRKKKEKFGAVGTNNKTEERRARKINT